MDGKQALWDQFCANHDILNSGVPLFQTDGLNVNTKPYGRDRRLVLQRSELMERMVITEVNKVIEDYHSHNEHYEGLIYLMFWKMADTIIPLYIGKSEKYGRQRNLSENILDIERNTGKFCRWGYNYAYHMGDLSSVVCPGHPEEKRNTSYARWAERLFAESPHAVPQLRSQTYFWMQAWRKGSVGAWVEFGETSLSFLEYQLIALAHTLYPSFLLNLQGVNRR